MQDKIRNFCIIAHIDHGKSTLADRFLELTKTVAKRQMKEQLLDTMDLERERGITIKLQPVRMEWQGYILNLIDTPGHVDFTYEVSRSLAACEGAILVVDSTQGIEAQTLANIHLAQSANLKIIPVVNKIDLPNSDREKTANEMIKAFGFSREEILYSSGKSGEGVEKILEEVIHRLPAPTGEADKPLRALIFDSAYDKHRGVVAFVRVVDGKLKKNEKIQTLGTKTSAEALEVGFFRPKFEAAKELLTGEVGYIVTGLRDVRKARVGDTISSGQIVVEALPGYKQVKPMVYASIFPTSGDDYPLLRDATDKLKLSDAALDFEPESIPALGFGFRTGFLGLLHMDVVQERLTREYGLDLVLTAPSVEYHVKLKHGGIMIMHTPAELPDPSLIESMEEPWVFLEVLAPSQYIGGILELITGRRGIYKNMEYLSNDRVLITAEMPLANIIIDFYDKLKSVSSGYASLNYELLDFRPADLLKLDILVATEKVDALSIIVHKDLATDEGRSMVEKLKKLIPRQQFEIALQAAIGGKIIARETIPAMRKDVTKGLYGGDVTRKMKLLEKQKKGKKRLKRIGSVDIPQEAFLAILKK
ncbi:MAG: elongation factor 4 [Candidatus Doudnabacteria bacterium RIFCSPLOWO2_01_FULL_44_21]|uniref:Elongation factor 4 n=1 Tax=Candidatus Doudnabacteria bacterium RIFCSPLOWO2_01_FULL_44_21 TaxID=1817841 RepID=A0A1F5PWS2_9BACT|nr:MAG: elongation factor 4 [Candidatus Doudnabacteria bacterium RIFCSPHIGHO2_02_FULL_43_13b]OGE94393.1 MAG: elongation factor 4 [Candidatus Doudnabacteria bacterium RIFCSPLOWO2_01_FULL_44_21]